MKLAHFRPENINGCCRLKPSQERILGLKTPSRCLKTLSRGPENIFTYIQYHLRKLRSSLKNHEKSHFIAILLHKGTHANMGYWESYDFRMQLWVGEVDNTLKYCQKCVRYIKLLPKNILEHCKCIFIRFRKKLKVCQKYGHFKDIFSVYRSGSKIASTNSDMTYVSLCWRK